MASFTNKFKVKDRVICVRQTEPIANMQVNDTGVVFKADASWKKYGVKIDGKEAEHSACWMRENDIESLKEYRLKLIKTKIKGGKL